MANNIATAKRYYNNDEELAKIDKEVIHDKLEKLVLKKLKRIYNTKYNKKEEDLKIAVVLERPMINCERFKQSKNAARAFESTLMVLEMLGLNENYIIIDSNEKVKSFLLFAAIFSFVFS